MRQQLIFTLPLPPSINAQYADVIKQAKSGKLYTRRIASSPLQQFKASASSLLYQQGLIAGMWTGVESVRYELSIYTRTRRSDLSNRLKAYEDVVSSYLGFDDSKIDEGHFHRRLDSQRPRIEGCWYLLAS